MPIAQGFLVGDASGDVEGEADQVGAGVGDMGGHVLLEHLQRLRPAGDQVLELRAHCRQSLALPLPAAFLEAGVAAFLKSGLAGGFPDLGDFALGLGLRVGHGVSGLSAGTGDDGGSFVFQVGQVHDDGAVAEAGGTLGFHQRHGK